MHMAQKPGRQPYWLVSPLTIACRYSHFVAHTLGVVLQRSVSWQSMPVTCSIDQSDSGLHSFVGWLVGWPAVGWLAGWVGGWVAGWVHGWVVGCLTACELLWSCNPLTEMLTCTSQALP